MAGCPSCHDDMPGAFCTCPSTDIKYPSVYDIHVDHRPKYCPKHTHDQECRDCPEMGDRCDGVTGG